jgi:type VI secretion system protein ImpG
LDYLEYYEREMRYFLEEAHRFALAYPVQARALNIEDVRERDPHVERLIEGFAFLSAGIRKRIDDDYADIAQDLIHLVWPHYLYPLPASVMLEFSPIPGRTIPQAAVEKGAIVESRPVSTGLPCRFSTVSTVGIRPLIIKDVGMQSLPDGQSAIRIQLSIEGMNTAWQDINRDPLKLYLHGDPGFALSLYDLLNTEVGSVVIQWKEQGQSKKRTLSDDVLKPTIISPELDDPLLPHPVHTFPGFRLLEEYFFYHDKFLFFYLDILKAVDNPDDDADVEIDLVLQERLRWDIRPKADTFRLHCTPAVNLFPTTAEPIHLDNSRLYHKISVDYAVAGHYVPHHVKGVDGIRMEDGKRQSYPSFFSYRHERDQLSSGYYHTRLHVGSDNQPDHHIAVFRPNYTGPEVISVDLLCGNDPVVQEVRASDVKHPFKDVPDYVAVRNLTAAVAPVWPSLDGPLIWELVNCLALNYQSLDNLSSLKDMLMACDRTRDRKNHNRINGIETLSTQPLEKLFKGYLVRGLTMDLTINEEKFTNPGDVLLFSQVLSRVISGYVPINSFFNLRVTEKKSQRIHCKWPDIQIQGSKKSL